MRYEVFIRISMIIILNITASRLQALDWSELQSMTLDDLSQVDITAADKIPTPLHQTAASVYIIDAQDIRRSGASTLFEVLQLAPNLQIGRQDAHQGYVSSRGFFDDFSNKMQVLLDGRILYTPLYSAVHWDSQDVLVDDIKQIEVMSGPADVSWGANAMNGVINIVTFSAQESSSVVSMEAGSMQSHAAARYAQSLSNQSAFKVYGKTVTSDDSLLENGEQSGDDWTRRQAGFRYDVANIDQHLQVQGGFYQGDMTSDQVPLSIDGWHLLASLRLKQSHGELNFLGYFDFADRKYERYFQETLATSYFEARYLFNSYGMHEYLIGLDYRFAKDDTENFESYGYRPEDIYLDWTSFYIQDRVTLAQDLKANLGVRFEQNPFSGLEYMPSARIIWNHQANMALWLAVSRNIRSPSRSDTDIVMPNEPPYIVTADDNFQSEVAKSFQIGWKGLIYEDLYLNATLFYTEYKKLHAAVYDNLHYFITNALDADVKGMELWGSLLITPQWTLKAGATFLDEDFAYADGAGPFLNMSENAPVQQLTVQSQFDLTPTIEFDFYYRYIDKLTYSSVPERHDFDIKFAWWPQSNLEVSLKGDNLLNSHQMEYSAIGQNNHYFERNYKLGLRWYP